MRIAAIVAATPELVIGVGGKIPWDSPHDRSHFRRITARKPIVVGRKTYESLPGPLPDRKVIVLSRGPVASREPVHVVDSPAAAIARAEALGAPELVVGGGAEVYAAFEPRLDAIYWSRIRAAYGDPDATRFPFDPFKSPDWRVVAEWCYSSGAPVVEFFVLVRNPRPGASQG